MIFIHKEPPSIRSLLVQQVFRRAGIASDSSQTPHFLVRQYTKSILSANPPLHVRARMEVRSLNVAGYPVHALIPNVQACARSILYLHGGSYLFTFTRQHWNFLARLAERTGSIIIAPDYPLAPSHTWAEAYRFLFDLHAALGPVLPFENTMLMGDSAGGGLALGFAMALRDRALQLPASVVMLSPWLDVTLENPQIAEIQQSDPMLNADSLRKAGRAWAGHSNPRRPDISPIYGDARNLPPLSLFIGTCDILLADCRKFRNLCAARGIPLDYYEYEHMMHVWMLLPVDESKEAMDQIEGLVSTQAACLDPDAVRAFFVEEGR